MPKLPPKKKDDDKISLEEYRKRFTYNDGELEIVDEKKDPDKKQSGSQDQ